MDLQSVSLVLAEPRKNAELHEYLRRFKTRDDITDVERMRDSFWSTGVVAKSSSASSSPRARACLGDRDRPLLTTLDKDKLAALPVVADHPGFDYRHL